MSIPVDFLSLNALSKVLPRKLKNLMNLLLHMLLYGQGYYDIHCKSFQRNQNLKAALISVS